MSRLKRDFSPESVERVCSILERLAMQFAPDSDERHAVEEASYALVFLTSQKALKASYEKYRGRCGKPLTKAQQAVLKQYGIEP